MDLASASTSQSTDESVLVLNLTTRSLPRTGDPIWSLRLETPGKPVQHFDAVSGRAYLQNAGRHRSGTRVPLPAGRSALDLWSPWVLLIRVISGLSVSGFHRSSPLVEAILAFISTPVLTAMPKVTSWAVLA